MLASALALFRSDQRIQGAHQAHMGRRRLVIDPDVFRADVRVESGCAGADGEGGCALSSGRSGLEG